MRAKRATIIQQIKNAKNDQFGEFLKSEAYDQTVLPDRSKIGGKCQNSYETIWVIFKQCGNFFNIESQLPVTQSPTAESEKQA